MSSPHDSNSAVAGAVMVMPRPATPLCYEQHHMVDFREVCSFVHRLREMLVEADENHSEGIVSLLEDLIRHSESYLAVRARRITELIETNYQEYLASPEWGRTRKAALERADYRCQLCSSTGPLNVHHNTYERRGFEANKDLLVLCRSCHALHHGKAE